MEGYYQIQVTPWLAIAPHVQYVATPGGDETAKDATVVGVRVQAAF
jgi:carbohydrate-selective porin OprB